MARQPKSTKTESDDTAPDSVITAESIESAIADTADESDTESDESTESDDGSADAAETTDSAAEVPAPRYYALPIRPSMPAPQYRDWSIDVRRLPPASIEYLLTNGFTQALSDAGANAPENVLRALIKAKAVPDTMTLKRLRALENEDVETAIAKEAFRLRQKRFFAIRSGDVEPGGGSGPRVIGVDREMVNVAAEWLRAQAAARKQPAPKGAPYLRRRAKMLLPSYARYDELRAEAQRRVDAAAKLIDSIPEPDDDDSDDLP